MNISEKKIVSVTYDLYVGGENGAEQELMEQATQEAPLTFCFGIGMMLPRFEEELKGKKVGDKFDFTINHTEAYGEADDQNIIDLSKDIFMVDGKFDDEMITEGNIVPLMDNEGNRINAQIVSVNEDTVTVDLNHPLAGEDLHFIGEVIEVREATEQELAMFMNPGGCGGGCGCSSDDCGDGGCGDSGCGCGH
jgi:FKBP-type peptidyl-prolyl cis-trans isomerase SlyD